MIALDCIDSESITNLISYMYTGTIAVHDSGRCELEPLLSAAKYLHMTHAVQLIEETLETMEDPIANQDRMTPGVVELNTKEEVCSIQSTDIHAESLESCDDTNDESVLVTVVDPNKSIDGHVKDGSKCSAGQLDNINEPISVEEITNASSYPKLLAISESGLNIEIERIGEHAFKVSASFELDNIIQVFSDSKYF